MLDAVIALPVLILLYGAYWIGAVSFHLHDRSAAPDLLVQASLGLLAMVPALLLISLLTQVSAWFGHPVSGWLGVGLMLLLLAHPLVIAAKGSAGQRASTLLSLIVARPRTVTAALPARQGLIAAICLVVALASLTQVSPTLFRERADGVIASKIPYTSRRGSQQWDVVISFSDREGIRHSFRDTTKYIPLAAVSPIGVFYDPANPARRPLPDLDGWEQADNLRMLLLVAVFGRVAFTGLARDKTPVPSAPKPAPTPAASRPRTSTPKAKADTGQKSARKLTHILDHVREQMREAIPALGYSCDQIFYAGAFNLAPHHLFFGIGVRTDAERDRMNADPAINRALHDLLRAHGYPGDAIPRVGVRAESQETVDRDWGGEWHRVWQ